MIIIRVDLSNCSTKQEYYQTLGNVLLAQKLLNDYTAVVNEGGIGPEGFSEEWMRNNGVEGIMKDKVSRFFFSSLQLIGRCL